jgi:uncharacterized membrane protein
VFAIVLFIHLAGVAMLFAACGLEVTLLVKVHRARETAGLRAALADGVAISKLFPLATAVVVGSGIAMILLTGMEWRAGWLLVSVALVIALSLIGPFVTGRKMQALAVTAFGSTSMLVDDASDAARRDLVLNVAGYASTAGAVAILFLMSNKPSLPGALLVVAVAAIVSVTLGVRGSRRDSALAEQRIAV